MSYGSLKTLMTMLREAATLDGVSLVFGEEMVPSQDSPLPMVVVVPRGGPWVMPGYYRDANVDQNAIWMTRETVDFYLWAASTNELQQDPIDHADAVETLRMKMLQTLQQQLPRGLYYIPVSGQWQTMDQASIRFGRAYVLTVTLDISVPDVQPVDATIEEVTITPSFTE